MSSSFNAERRRLLRTALTVAGVVTATPAAAWFRALRAQQPTAPVWDVVVIGGGLAGLSAADTIARAGRSVLVLEAQDRLGGRVLTTTHDLPGHGAITVERGAQLFHADMQLLRALVRRAGHRELQLPVDVAAIRLDGTGRRLMTDDAGLSLLNSRLIDRHLGAGDGSVQALLDAVMEDATRPTPLDLAVLASSLTELLSQSLSALSARGVLEIASTQPGFHEDDRQASGGLDAVVRTLAASLPVAPRLASPVTSIRGDADGSTVAVTDRALGPTQLRARRVIVAVPPPIARRLDIAPLAPATREALSAWVPGDMVKVTAIFTERFWRRTSSGTGMAISVDPPGITMRDVSRPGESIGRLVIFAGGPAGRRWAALDDVARQREVQALLARVFAGTAPEPVALITGNWVDHPWSAGGYNSWLSAGGPPEVRATLRRGDGSVTFAGAELATRYAGYMEGALHNGRETARRVVASLDRR